MSPDTQLDLFAAPPVEVDVPPPPPIVPTPTPAVIARAAEVKALQDPPPAKPKSKNKKKKGKAEEPPPPKRTIQDIREDNVRSMRCCWPEWEGPRVEDSVHGRCQVGQCSAYNLTKGCVTYLYCVPLRILDVSGDGITVLGEINYPDDIHDGLREQNGEQVLLDIWEVWPPTDELWVMRRAAWAAEEAAAKESAETETSTNDADASPPP